VIRNSTRRIAVAFLCSDLAATLLALVAAYELRFRAEIVAVTKGVPDASLYYRLFPLIALLWPIVYYFHGLYQVRRFRSRIEEGLAILVATGLATLLLTGLATFYRGFSYSRLVLLLFFAADVLFVLAGRTAIRRYLEEAWRHGVGVRQVLVVGAGRLGRAVVDKLLEHPEAGLRAVGIVDDDPEKQNLGYRGVPGVGATADTARLVEERGIDTVFLALPLEAHRTMLAVLKDVGRTVADVRVVPDLMQYITFRAGMTGWAQVHGWRGNTSLTKRIEYDLYYIENWSLSLDLKILWLTLRKGLRSRNAY
jgi:FlaA1/EpsC-like NDP-sugar epimerase